MSAYEVAPSARPLPSGMRSCKEHPKTGQIVYSLNMDTRYCSRCQEGASSDEGSGAGWRPVTCSLPRCHPALGTFGVAEMLGVDVTDVISIDHEAETAVIAVRR